MDIRTRLRWNRLIPNSSIPAARMPTFPISPRAVDKIASFRAAAESSALAGEILSRERTIERKKKKQNELFRCVIDWVFRLLSSYHFPLRRFEAQHFLRTRFSPSILLCTARNRLDVSVRARVTLVSSSITCFSSKWTVFQKR